MKPPQPPRPKILVADDEPQILELIRKALEKEGYAVVTASGFEEAVAKAHTEPFDLIILDAAMPDTPTSFTPDGLPSGTRPDDFEAVLKHWYLPHKDRNVVPPYPMATLLRYLRPRPDADTPPVIFLSFKAAEFYNWDMGDAKNFTYVTKPFHPRELLQFVHGLLPAPGP